MSTQRKPKNTTKKQKKKTNILNEDQSTQKV